jgi:hypothetical protein
MILEQAMDRHRDDSLVCAFWKGREPMAFPNIATCGPMM